MSVPDGIGLGFVGVLVVLSIWALIRGRDDGGCDHPTLIDRNGPWLVDAQWITMDPSLARDALGITVFDDLGVVGFQIIGDFSAPVPCYTFDPFDLMPFVGGQDGEMGEDL